MGHRVGCLDVGHLGVEVSEVEEPKVEVQSDDDGGKGNEKRELSELLT
jgi:hypothetical protein